MINNNADWKCKWVPKLDKARTSFSLLDTTNIVDTKCLFCMVCHDVRDIMEPKWTDHKKDPKPLSQARISEYITTCKLQVFYESAITTYLFVGQSKHSQGPYYACFCSRRISLGVICVV